LLKALIITTIITTGMLLTSCGGGGGGGGGDGTRAPAEVTHTVSGLAPNTTFFWKVTADDGKGGTAESAVRSFTTAP